MAAAEQGQVVIDGQKLNKVEAIKKAKDGLDVWNDLFRYAAATDVVPLDETQKAAFLASGGRESELLSAARRNAIHEDDFVRLRWFGCYQQLPNNGYFMLRIRIPNGFVTGEQMKVIADIVRQHGRGFADITTRQNFQLHWMTLEAIVDTLPRLEKVGLVTRFACGDTPRNVVGCPLAGYLADEIVDASQAVMDVHNLFLASGKEFSNLPRKFKSAIGGCHLHCHQPQINDIGIFGVKRRNASGAEERGYGLVVGGGLSTTPHFAQGLRVFIQPGQVAAVCKAIATIFRDHGYREKRTRARLKFLVADMGWEKFRDLLETTLGYKLERDNSIVEPPTAPHQDHIGVGRQKQEGLSYVGVPIERGRVTADQLQAAAEISVRYAGSKARLSLSNKQNLLFINIPSDRVSAMVKDLEKVGLTPHAPLWRDNLVTCTGTQFCNLAIVETKDRAAKILRYLEDEVQIDSPIMVSVTGCPNACAQYQIADIGLMGVVCNFRGVRGTEAYNVMLGGALGAGPSFAHLALKKVPADYIQKSIGQIVQAYKQHRVDAEETFRAFVGRNTPEQLAQWLTIPEMAEVL